MKIIEKNNDTQNEALLNEYKGNLFEFLVANFLAKMTLVENEFLSHLNSEYKLRLSMYEEFIRMNFPQLIRQLSLLAEKTGSDILIYLQKEEWTVLNCHLIGKMVATNSNDQWKETDLVIDVHEKKGNPRRLYFSLKLSKENSYTNTKSAGVKSFIKKYFSLFTTSLMDQEKYSKEIEFQFHKMGSKLYSMEGMEFYGQFNSEWTDRFASLPGELNEVHRTVVFENYAHVANALYEQLEKYYQEDYSLFVKSLFPLMGLGRSDLIQVVTFHEAHLHQTTRILSLEDIRRDVDHRKVVLKKIKPGNHYFDIVFDHFVLQIRIKPMNKFTTPSYKVNCSVKEWE